MEIKPGIPSKLGALIDASKLTRPCDTAKLQKYETTFLWSMSCFLPISMLRLPFGQLEIRIDNDPTFSFGSVDNPHSYDHAYRLDDEPYTPSSLHTVRVVQEDGHVFASCILGSAGGASGVHEHSAIVRADSLLIAVGPFIASLKLPELTLNWKVKTDWATCFGVYHSPENHCYLSHGECDVAGVSYDGAIRWSNSGADIFTNGFSVLQSQATAIDWNNDKYVWDIATGELIRSTANKKINPSSESGSC